jgi:hypothetical protein
VQILFVRDTSSRAEIRRENGKLFMNRPPLVRHLHIRPIYSPSNVAPWNKFASVALTTRAGRVRELRRRMIEAKFRVEKNPAQLPVTTTS